MDTQADDIGDTKGDSINADIANNANTVAVGHHIEQTVNYIINLAGHVASYEADGLIPSSIKKEDFLTIVQRKSLYECVHAKC